MVDELTCGANEVCRGAEGCECEAGFFDCDAAPGCETAESASACGGCGTVCESATPVCDAVADRCVSGCGPGVSRCETSCVSTQTDPAHCGGCAQACSSANGTPFCVAGSCSIMCDPGFGDCNADVADGCEQRLNTLAHCGGCNVPCGIEHTTVSCETGACVMTGCEALYDDCDGIAANGCEQSLESEAHCGACEAGCLVNESCDPPGTCRCGTEGSGPSGTGQSVCNDSIPNVTAGRCAYTIPARCAVVACDPGYGDCDGRGWNGCEVTLGSNSHCSRCRDACVAPATCVAGTCM